MDKRKPVRRLPNAETTTDENVYADAWIELGKKAESMFPGYVASSFDPKITLDKRRTTENGTYVVEDSITLSPAAIAAFCCPHCTRGVHTPQKPPKETI